MSLGNSKEALIVGGGGAPGETHTHIHAVILPQPLGVSRCYFFIGAVVADSGNV